MDTEDYVEDTDDYVDDGDGALHPKLLTLPFVFSAAILGTDSSSELQNTIRERGSTTT